MYSDRICAESVAKSIPKTQHFNFANLPNWPEHLRYVGKYPLPGVRSPWRWAQALLPKTSGTIGDFPYMIFLFDDIIECNAYFFIDLFVCIVG